MTEQDGGARPAVDRPGAENSVPKQRGRWQPDPRNVKALDRHITRVYGRQYTWRRWSA